MNYLNSWVVKNSWLWGFIFKNKIRQQLDGKRWTSPLSKLGDKGQVHIYDVVIFPMVPKGIYSRWFHANIFPIRQCDTGPFHRNPNIDLATSQNVACKFQRTKVLQLFSHFPYHFVALYMEGTKKGDNDTITTCRRNQWDFFKYYGFNQEHESST